MILKSSIEFFFRDIHVYNPIPNDMGVTCYINVNTAHAHNPGYCFFHLKLYPLLTILNIAINNLSSK